MAPPPAESAPPSDYHHASPPKATHGTAEALWKPQKRRRRFALAEQLTGFVVSDVRYLSREWPEESTTTLFEEAAGEDLAASLNAPSGLSDVLAPADDSADRAVEQRNRLLDRQSEADLTREEAERLEMLSRDVRALLPRVTDEDFDTLRGFAAELRDVDERRRASLRALESLGR